MFQCRPHCLHFRQAAQVPAKMSEFGNSTNTTSPCSVFIVDVGFRAVPIFGKRRQPRPQIGRLSLVNSTRP